MVEFTKKSMNKIKSAAFQEFKRMYTPDEFRDIFCGADIVSVWRITEGTQSKMLITQHDTQVNGNVLVDMGFSENAEVERLFSANRKTSTVEFVGGF